MKLLSTWLVVAALSGCSLHVRAMPMYLAEIPNARSVPRADDPEVPCGALGHTRCVGGTPRNSFGLAFAEAGYKWTLELCKADSDGDGVSNGEELGDPCCAWTKGNDGVLQFTDMAQLSHPGESSSTLSEGQLAATRSADCSVSQANEEPDDIVDTFYAPNEQRTTSRVDFTADIPVKETTYLRYTYNLPNEPAVNYLVGVQSVIGNINHMHHYVVSACRKPFPPEFDGSLTEECQDRSCGDEYVELQYEYNCIDIFYLWAPGLDHFTYPEGTAFPLGPGAGYPSVYIQIHYDNKDLRENETDSSGIIWHWTPNQREHDIGFLTLGPQLLHFQTIPPGEQSYYFSGRCSVDIDMDAAPDGLTVTDYFPHMHYRGRRLWSEILGEAASGENSLRKFAEVGKRPLGTLGNIDNFDSELNLGYKMKDSESKRKLNKGDLLATTCIFNTEDVTGPTRGGFGTYDEMCINFVMFYPAQAVPIKSCLNDDMDIGAPFHGVWPAELSQTKSSVLELPELAEALLSPMKEYGSWGYPTNNFTVLQQLQGNPDLGAEGLPTSQDIAGVVDTGNEGESDLSSAPAAQSSVCSLITILCCTVSMVVSMISPGFL